MIDNTDNVNNYTADHIQVLEGLEAVRNHHPDVKIQTAAIDSKLNAHKFIVPGLGDFGNRFFGIDSSI